MDGRPDDVTQILLAEYAALRAEAERRTPIQWNVVALQLASAGAITSLAIAAAANVALLLIVPLMSYMLGNRYILHDVPLKLIRRYIRDSLSTRLSGHLQREGWRIKNWLPTAPGSDGSPRPDGTRCTRPGSPSRESLYWPWSARWGPASSCGSLGRHRGFLHRAFDRAG
jgi:hypothetical protein